MKLIETILADPAAFTKKLVRVSAALFALVLALMVFKYRRDKAAEEANIRAEHFAKVEAEKQLMTESHWEEDIQKILPEQEPLLTPHVLPQLLIPPIFSKVAVPAALVHLRQKRYTAAYEFQKTPYIAFWTSPALAASFQDTRPIQFDLPAISKPAAETPPAPRQPKRPPGVEKTYILLP
ncbi:hypothetical protein HY522_05320 [bacterium]|nr:hypothetical protein [bacterium]